MPAHLPISNELRPGTEWSNGDQMESKGMFSPVACAAPSTALFPTENAVANLARSCRRMPPFGMAATSREARKQIEVSVVLENLRRREAYDIWVDFDLVPGFMRGLYAGSRVEQFAVSWILRLSRGDMNWEARITERVPCEHIAWEGIDGATCGNSGCVIFTTVGRASTRLRVNVAFDDPGAGGITERTLKCVESHLQNALAILRIFAGPRALHQDPSLFIDHGRFKITTPATLEIKANALHRAKNGSSQEPNPGIN